MHVRARAAIFVPASCYACDDDSAVPLRGGKQAGQKQKRDRVLLMSAKWAETGVLSQANGVGITSFNALTRPCVFQCAPYWAETGVSLQAAIPGVRCASAAARAWAAAVSAASGGLCD